METISAQEWMKTGTERFGVDRDRWKFVCPLCAGIQSGKNFIPYRSIGARVDMSYQQCIERLAGGECRFSTASHPELVTTQVEYGRGHVLPVMEFAEAEE